MEIVGLVEEFEVEGGGGLAVNGPGGDGHCGAATWGKVLTGLVGCGRVDGGDGRGQYASTP